MVKQQRLLYMAVICLLLVAVFYLIQRPNQTARTSAPPVPQVRSYTETIDAAFTIPQLNAKDYKFTVPAGARDVKIGGRFTATGGSGNDVEVSLMNEDQFVNWSNRHPVTPIYASQRVTQGTLDLPLPSDAATYYIVFDNRFSVFSPKAVQDNVALQYLK